MVAAGAVALERGLRLRGEDLGLGAAAAAAAAAVVPLVGEVEVGFEDFGARFLTPSMRWRIALGVQSEWGVRWGGEVSGWWRDGRVKERGGGWRAAVDSRRSGWAGWGMRTGTHDFGESIEQVLGELDVYGFDDCGEELEWR